MAKRPTPQPTPTAPAWPADQVARRAIAELIPYARNARTHTDEQIAQIAGSIREWGWTMPVLLDEGGIIIAGHGRVLAAQRLGLPEVPVMVARGWSDAQIRAYRIADNRLALNAGWDDDLLRVEMTQLQDERFNLDLIGFSDREIADLLQGEPSDGLTDPDTVPPVPSTATSRRGDLWLLGQHRLLCGDSTNEADVTRLMNGERAMLFATDPPYAVDYAGGVHPAVRETRMHATRDKNWSEVYREADIEQDDNGEAFFRRYLTAAVNIAISDHAAWYCWLADRRISLMERLWDEHGAFLHQQVIWVKTRPVLNRCLYMYQHEPCMVGWVRGNKPNSRTQAPDFDSKTTVWAVAARQNSDDFGENVSRNHPTSKPVRLFTTPMQAHTLTGGLCYEPFSGSGTQLMAAQTLGRRCYAMEITPVFVDVAIERWQAFTGQAATLDGDGRSFAELARERGAEAPTLSEIENV